VKRLYKSDKDKQLAGVLAGIAEYANLDATLVRVLYFLATVFSGVIPGIIAYVGLAIIMPSKSEVTDAKEEHKD
jgi:phage shock protein C